MRLQHSCMQLLNRRRERGGGDSRAASELSISQPQTAYRSASSAPNAEDSRTC